MAEDIVEQEGDGITQRTNYRTSYRLYNPEENQACIEELECMFEKIKQPWRGKKDWVEKIRAQAAD